MVRIVLALVAMIACGGQASPAELTDTDRAAIRQYFDELARTLSPEDNRAWANLYAEDATLMFQGTPVMHGREAIYEFGENDSPVALSVSFSDIEIHGSGDWAWATSNYVATIEDVEGPVLGKQLLVLRRQPDGTWLSAAVHVSEDSPRPPGN